MLETQFFQTCIRQEAQGQIGIICQQGYIPVLVDLGEIGALLSAISSWASSI